MAGLGISQVTYSLVGEVVNWSHSLKDNEDSPVSSASHSSSPSVIQHKEVAVSSLLSHSSKVTLATPSAILLSEPLPALSNTCLKKHPSLNDLLPYILLAAANGC